MPLLNVRLAGLTALAIAMLVLEPVLLKTSGKLSLYVAVPDKLAKLAEVVFKAAAPPLPALPVQVRALIGGGGFASGEKVATAISYLPPKTTGWDAVMVVLPAGRLETTPPPNMLMLFGTSNTFHCCVAVPLVDVKRIVGAGVEHAERFIDGCQ